MFKTLSERLEGVFRQLRNRGALSEADVDKALRDIRIALLEADVGLDAVKSFISGVREKAVGSQVLRSITPGQMVVKIVHEHLIQLLTSPHSLDLDLAAQPPVVILVVGLQGSGKTTTTAKLASFLGKRVRKKVLMASVDVYRPAAREQLKVLGESVGIATLPLDDPITPGSNTPLAIAKRALHMAKHGGFDVLLVDTAGRLHVDGLLMEELSEITTALSPKEILLVADGMMGQDAIPMAQAFQAKIPLTGVVLSRFDSDARGGAALSLSFITGLPLKFLGIGEKVDDLEPFSPERVAGRILGMGDVVTLVEKMTATLHQEDAARTAASFKKGTFTLDDLSVTLQQMEKMGGVGTLAGMIPGVGKMMGKVDGAMEDRAQKTVGRHKAILSSMTPKERQHPGLLNGSRRKRIALGSGTSVPEVNRLMKQYEEMAAMMKRMGKLGQKGRFAQGLKGMFGR